MEQVVIVDAIRTPMGRSKGGAFRNVRAEDLSAHLMRSLLARNPSLTAATLDDIYWAAYNKRWSKASTLPVTPRCWQKFPIRYRRSPSTVCVVPRCRRYTMQRE